VGSVDRRLQNLERVVEERVEARVREELELVVERLTHHLTREELRRVLEILAAGDEEERRIRERPATVIGSGNTGSDDRKEPEDGRALHP
jgi:hypothetical protein